MTRAPQVRLLADGRRLHLQDGPIDLVVQAFGADVQVERAYRAAVDTFTGLLDTLCAELPELRRPAEVSGTRLRGRVAQRMLTAVAPFAADHFITPMAAVAGAVAEEILGAMIAVADLDRAYVNNGGDIALHLRPGTRFSIGLVDRPDTPSLIGTAVIAASQRSRGIATSGRHGRSFSLGIADAVTVLAATAAQADAAATIIANAVDLPGHPAVTRVPACELQPDNDLGHRLVTRDVARLSRADVDMALDAGVVMTERLVMRGLIDGAALRLQGESRSVGIDAAPSIAAPLSVSQQEAYKPNESLMHA
ncbi:UPF0280 family protein [Bradyrhizobium prioriisuperbiae]|uniref:UPF0280 family protein n=1 Tax=Bradyrhizobium prioriisuperbiae TaxID=2854389 RepID=UPI0028EB947B|nr:UPF0280 family protein [Bradyrhizobium prioritasuperba]